MRRHEQREQVFKLLFRVDFHVPEDMPEQAELFLTDSENIPGSEDAEYIGNKYRCILEKLSEINTLIDENATGWDTTRMGKVELTVLRLSVYEMLFDDDIPKSVAIDEAVEIAKKYGQDGAGSFVNAILAKIVKLGE